MEAVRSLRASASTYLDDEQIQRLYATAEELAAVYEEKKAKAAKTKTGEEKALQSVTPAEAELLASENALKEWASQNGAAAESTKETSAEIRKAEEVVTGARDRVRRFGGTGGGTGELNPPVFPALTDEEAQAAIDELIFKRFDLDGSGDIDRAELKYALSALGLTATSEQTQAVFNQYDTDGSGSIEQDEFRSLVNELREAELKKISGRELDEVRKMANPPQVIRRTLEMVQSLLMICEGEWSDLRPLGQEATWKELAQMLAKSGFLQRIVNMKAIPLSTKPDILDEIGRRWPGLLEAAKGDQDGPEGGGTPRKGSGSSSSLGSKMKNAAIAGAASSADGEGTETPTKGGVPGAKLQAAISAAAVEERPEDAVLTIEAVEYASRPCGTVFRWCAYVVNHAARIADERAKAQAELDVALRALAGCKTELWTQQESGRKLGEEETNLIAARQAAAKEVEAVREKHKAASEKHTEAKRELEEARKAAQSAMSRAKREEDNAKRKKEEMEQREKDEEERARNAQAALDHPPATADDEALAKRLCWVFEHKLPLIKPLEFMTGSPQLPPDATIPLTKLAKELKESPHLKLHIAGHAMADEDSKLSSQRAQAVGAAMIALGVMPSRLRAKGYGSQVALTAAMRARLKLKTERRVGIHAISEVSTKYPLEFAPKTLELSERVTELLGDVAALMRDDAALRLSIEGHADDRGDAQENAKLSVGRAQAVQKYLGSLGVESSRLVAHGFGATLPLEDNASEEGRARNRRVQFLVIPDVRRA